MGFADLPKPILCWQWFLPGCVSSFLKKKQTNKEGTKESKKDKHKHKHKHKRTWTWCWWWWRWWFMMIHDDSWWFMMIIALDLFVSDSPGSHTFPWTFDILDQAGIRHARGPWRDIHRQTGHADRFDSSNGIGFDSFSKELWVGCLPQNKWCYHKCVMLYHECFLCLRSIYGPVFVVYDICMALFCVLSDNFSPTSIWNRKSEVERWKTTRKIPWSMKSWLVKNQNRHFMGEIS